MWLVFALITFLAWGTADLFYKKGAFETERYAHLKTSIVVGVVMGAVALGTLLIKGIDYNPLNLLIYLPVSAMYILSMTVGYFGLRYLELSVSSPIQNASGAVSALIMMIVLREFPTAIQWVAIVFITFGVVMLGVLEKKKENAYIAEHDRKYKIGFIAFLMPIFYCVLDSIGTALDGIYLDDFTTTPLVDVTEETFEDVANISYMFTFLIVAVILSVYVYGIRRQPIFASRNMEKVDAQDGTPILKRQGVRFAAAVCEAAGQFTYVYAISGNGVVAAPLIGSYCVASVLLARIFLKEKCSLKQYLVIACVLVGILLLGIAEGLAE